MSSVTEVFANDRAEIRRLGEVAERFGAAERLSDEDVMAINLVLDELVTNTIEYGYEDAARHEIQVTLALEGGTLTIRIEDDARAFDPVAAPPPDLTLALEDRPVGGLGIHLVRSVMDSVEYQRHEGRNILTMRKTIGRP
jgi:anti-sigma regulatory factor (Ser/Thr protein kinase)